MTNLPPPLQIGMLIYPGVTLLDFIGPLTALGATEKVHLVSKTLDPVLSDSGVAIVPTTTLETCPSDLDVLFVPGGFGTADVMEDKESLRFLADRGRRAKYVTAVCSGSLILATAGLLEGYRATTHWSSYDVLAALGVEVSEERVVVDRNRITGGGVTAGIDFGLVLLARLRGDSIAKMSQLAMEYDPAPPFDAGRPQKAGPEATAMARNFISEVHARTLSIAERRAPTQA
jgi:cyclohexyl-isocyanide hydratase